MPRKQPTGLHLPVRNGAFDQFLKLLPRQELSPFLEGLRVSQSKFILADSHQPKSADISFYICPGQLKPAEYSGGPFVSLFELSHLFFEIKHRLSNPLSSSYAPTCHVPWRRRAAAPRAPSCPGRRRRACRTPPVRALPTPSRRRPVPPGEGWRGRPRSRPAPGSKSRTSRCPERGNRSPSLGRTI